METITSTNYILDSGNIVTVSYNLTMGDLMIISLLMVLVFFAVCGSVLFLALRISYTPIHDLQIVMVGRDDKNE